MRPKFTIFCLLIAFQIGYPQSKSTFTNDLVSAIDKNAQDLMQKSKAYSVSVGIVKDGKIFTKHYGEIDLGKNNKANDNTYFEIASITKLFTGQLLAKAVLDKKVSLNDDIRKYLNGNYPNLQYNQFPIKIRDLISFTSALPRNLPDDSEILKTNNNETAFLHRELFEKYSKNQFFKDLKTIKLDTIPGHKFDYSNLSLELTAVILENVYKEKFNNLLSENILSRLGMKNTKFQLSKNEVLANGYNQNHILMPHFANNLWGSESYLKSTLNDLMKFLNYELDLKNPVVSESQRNVEKSKENWHGYFWDDFFVTEKGRFGYKHGGAYGTQTFFAIYPEQNLGICIIVNIDNTFPILLNSVTNIAEDLINKSEGETDYGYKIQGKTVVFSYRHSQNLNSKLINSVNVAGSFNNWNPYNYKYQMKDKGNGLYQLELPISDFEYGKDYQFKFVINKVGWITTPNNASNVDGTEDNNLVMKIK